MSGPCFVCGKPRERISPLCDSCMPRPADAEAAPQRGVDRDRGEAEAMSVHHSGSGSCKGLKIVDRRDTL
jgi:hypothetical protein